MTKFECGTPQGIVSRWLLSLKRRKGKVEGLDSGNERRGDRRRRKGKDSDAEEMRSNCSTKCLNEELVTELSISCECGRHVGEGHSKNNEMFSLGAGFGLAFLVASSKMMELHEQMASLVQRAKDDLQSIDKVSKSSRAHRRVDYSTTEEGESMNSNRYISHTDYTPSESRISIPLRFQDQKSQHGESRQACPHLDRKIMETELESELNHLQLLCESEEHQDGPNQFQIQDHDGVPPEELALRLHELLESKQEERIKELESALKQVLQKLDEKQSEASWWKETAQLFSQRLPEAHSASSSSSLRPSEISPAAAPHCSKRSIRLAEKLSSEILMNP